MGFNTTDDRIFMVETLPPFERINFQFMPENLSWTRTAKIQPIAVTGRNNDLFQYTGGSDTLNFSIDFFSDEPNREDVQRKVNFLKSLAMTDAGFGPARNVKIIMGKFLRDEVWIVKSVNATYSNYDNRFEYLPIRSTVKIQLILDPERNRRIRDVRG